MENYLANVLTKFRAALEQIRNEGPAAMQNGTAIIQRVLEGWEYATRMVNNWAGGRAMAPGRAMNEAALAPVRSKLDQLRQLHDDAAALAVVHETAPAGAQMGLFGGNPILGGIMAKLIQALIADLLSKFGQGITGGGNTTTQAPQQPQQQAGPQQAQAPKATAQPPK